MWTYALIRKAKRVYNPLSREVDFWFDNTIEGYITEFVVDRMDSYSQDETYFFKDIERIF